MGATTIVEFFPWAYYQAEDGGIAWEHPDMVIDHAHAQGLKVYRPHRADARLGPPTGHAAEPTWIRRAIDDFAEFAAAFAERYAGQSAGNHRRQRAQSEL